MKKILLVLVFISASLSAQNLRIVPGVPNVDVIIEERQAQIDAIMRIHDLKLIEATLVNLLQEATEKTKNTSSEKSEKINKIIEKFIIDMDEVLKK